ncbi:MAG: outer membrane beta-barrel protein [Alphaproteobacteria bacterium]
MNTTKTSLLALALTTVASLATAEMQNTNRYSINERVPMNATKYRAETSVVPVSQRVAKENAPLGVRAGSFVVTPKADLEETYNDNVYATKNNTKSDFITTVRPEVAVQSNWSRHALNALARAEMNKFADNSSENTNNTALAIDGRVDVMKETSLGGGVSWVRNHEERGDPNAIGSSVEPTAVDTKTARLGAYRGLGRFNVRVDGEAKTIDFKNGYTTTGGTVNNSLRDRNEYLTSARVGYKATPGTEVFVKGEMDNRVYNQKGGTTVNRSNHGDKIVVGLDMEMTGKTKAEVYGGVMSRNYVDPSLKDNSGSATYGAKLLWNATDITSVMGSIDRSIEETSLANSSGYENTSYRLGVEHSVMRNTVANAGLGYTTSDYKGTGVQRNDDVLMANVGAKYYFNRNFSTGASYEFRNRDSNIANGGYDRNVFMLRLTGTY